MSITTETTRRTRTARISSVFSTTLLTLIAMLMLTPSTTPAQASESGAGAFLIAGPVSTEMRARAFACDDCTWSTRPACADDEELCLELARGCPVTGRPQFLRITEHGRSTTVRICASAITPLRELERQVEERTKTPSIAIAPARGLLDGRPVIARAVIPGFRGRAQRCRWLLDDRPIASPGTHDCDRVEVRPKGPQVLRLEWQADEQLRLPGLPARKVTVSRRARLDLRPGTLRPAPGPGPEH